MSKKSKSTPAPQAAAPVEITVNQEPLTEGNEPALPDSPTDGPPSDGAALEVIPVAADEGNDGASGAEETTTEVPSFASVEGNESAPIADTPAPSVSGNAGASSDDGPPGYEMTWQEVCGALVSSLEDTKAELKALKAWCASHVHPALYFLPTTAP